MASLTITTIIMAKHHHDLYESTYGLHYALLHTTYGHITHMDNLLYITPHFTWNDILYGISLRMESIRSNLGIMLCMRARAFVQTKGGLLEVCLEAQSPKQD